MYIALFVAGALINLFAYLELLRRLRRAKRQRRMLVKWVVENITALNSHHIRGLLDEIEREW